MSEELQKDIWGIISELSKIYYLNNDRDTKILNKKLSEYVNTSVDEILNTLYGTKFYQIKFEIKIVDRRYFKYLKPRTEIVSKIIPVIEYTKEIDDYISNKMELTFKDIEFLSYDII